jgi:hypothetical protein
MNPRTKSRWPIWRIILTYALLAALAVASVWFVDQKVHHLPAPESSPESTEAAR